MTHAAGCESAKIGALSASDFTAAITEFIYPSHFSYLPQPAFFARSAAAEPFGSGHARHWTRQLVRIGGNVQWKKYCGRDAAEEAPAQKKRGAGSIDSSAAN